MGRWTVIFIDEQNEIIIFFISGENVRSVPTSFPGSLFSASLSRWNRDPGCGWSRDYLSIQNRGTQVHLVERKTLLPHPSSRFFYHPDSGWSRDRPQRIREAEKRDPGNEVGSVLEFVFFPNRQLCIFLAAIHVCKNRLNASNSANHHAGCDPPSGFKNTWEKKWFPEGKHRFQDPSLGPRLKAKWEVQGTRLQHEQKIYLAVNLKGATMELNAHIGSPVWIISYHFTAISWGTLQTQKKGKQK